MIKAILIDDEKPALKELEYLLADYPEIDIRGLFTNPILALEKIEEVQPQIVFLDINMPQVHGIDMASKIIDSNANTDIVFVTAFNTYAVEAFELYALDYLLKPINKQRFEKTIQRIVEKNKEYEEETDEKLRIKCFGEFTVGWKGQEPIKWRTEKTKELFAFLLHNRNKIVSKHKIIDAIWPDIEPEKAEHQLYNAIYYIRKNLAKYNISRKNILISGNYCLKLGDVDFDLINFNQYLIKNISTLHTNTLQKIEREFSGEYFENCDWAWAEYDRSLYARQYYEISNRLSEIYYANKDFKKAERLLLKTINTNQYEENPVLLLMNTYLKMNNKYKAIKLYHDFSQLLMNDLAVKPSNKLIALYNLISA